ncbi:hypothetical protein QX51_01360, partial [Terrisporobacter othiniensis]
EVVKLLEKYNYTLVSNFDKWSDLEKGLGKYLGNVTLENIEKFFNDYENLRSDLEHYLSKEGKNLMHSYDDGVNINELKNSLIKFYDFLTPKDKNDILRKSNINSLNYENIFSPIIHIHGKLDEEMIIGVDNKTQIFNNDIRDNEEITYLIKPLCNEELRNEKIHYARI